MKSYRRTSVLRIAAGLVVIASLLPGRSSAQVAAGGNTTINSTGAGYLGILQMKCDCTLRLDPEDRFRTFRFRSDPVVTSIESGSPADGIIRPGDYITHIDGQRLRSTDGSQRFADIRPGQTVELTIWREGVTSRVRIKATGVAWSDRRVMGALAPTVAGYETRWESWDNGAAGVIAAGTPMPARPVLPAEPAVPGFPAPARLRTPAAQGRAQRAPEAPIAPHAPVAQAAPGAEPPPRVWAIVPDSRATPSGWFGFSFRCTDCGWARRGNDSDPVWESDEAPELSMISAGGPAARAGLRRGDKLTHIDGYSITSAEGARRLGAVKPGQKVRLTVLRNGTVLTNELTLGRRPEARAASAVVAATPPSPRRPGVQRELRYTGKIDDVSVEVWSAAGSSVTRVGDTMVITVGGTVVRLKVDPKK